jgi:hypothetical protein
MKYAQMVQKIQYLEEKLKETNAIVITLSNNLETVTGHVQLVNKQYQDLNRILLETLKHGKDIKETGGPAPVGVQIRPEQSSVVEHP